MEKFENRVTNRQIFFYIFLIITTYTTVEIPQLIAQTSGRSGWVPLLIISVIFGGGAYMVSKVNTMHPGKNLLEYGENLIGKFFINTIAIYFLLYFMAVGVYLKIKFADLVMSNFLPKTPQIVIVLIGTFLFGYIAYKGVTNVGRLLELIGILFIIVSIALCIFMLIEGMDFSILPFFNRDDIKEFSETLWKLTIPFGGIEVLFMMRFTKANQKSPKNAFLTLILIGIFYVLVVESSFMVLGVNNAKLLNDSFIEAIKVTQVPIFERLDVFYLTFGVASLFAGMIIIYTSALEFACKIFSKVKRLYLDIIIGVIFFFGGTVFMGTENYEKIFESIFGFFIILSDFILPAILLIFSIRKKRNGNKVSKEKSYAKS